MLYWKWFHYLGAVNISTLIHLFFEETYITYAKLLFYFFISLIFLHLFTINWYSHLINQKQEEENIKKNLNTAQIYCVWRFNLFEYTTLNYQKVYCTNELKRLRCIPLHVCIVLMRDRFTLLPDWASKARKRRYELRTSY